MTKEILFMNCMELDFATKVELEHWMATFEEKVWTNDIMKKLSKAGLVRTTAAQVWTLECGKEEVDYGPLIVKMLLFKIIIL